MSTLAKLRMGHNALYTREEQERAVRRLLWHWPAMPLLPNLADHHLEGRG